MNETARKELIENLQGLDFSYNGWNPTVNIWRAGEGQTRDLPYGTVDFVATSEKLFPSLSDIVGRIDDFRFEHAYCELELVNISFYTNKYHNKNKVRGRDYCEQIIRKARNKVLASWDKILIKYNACIHRGFAVPIRDLTNYQDDVATRTHEYDFNVFLKTDVRWYKDLPSGYIDEKAEKAYIVMNNINNIRINTS